MGFLTNWIYPKVPPLQHCLYDSYKTEGEGMKLTQKWRMEVSPAMRLKNVQMPWLMGRYSFAH